MNPHIAIPRILLLLIGLSISVHIPSSAVAQIEEDDMVDASITTVLRDAYAMYFRGDTAGAIRSWRALLDVDSTVVLAHLGIGSWKYALDEYDTALVAFRTALRHAPDDESCLDWLAWTHYQLGDNAPAEAAALRAIERGDMRLSPRILLVRIYWASDRDSLALDMAGRAVGTCTDSDDFLSIAAAFDDMHAYDRACDVLNTACQRDSTNDYLLMELARADYLAGRHDAALSALERGKGVGVPDSILGYMQYMIAHKIGDAALARRARSALSAPESQSFDSLLVEAHLITNTASEAVRSCYDYLRLHPLDTSVILRLIRALTVNDVPIAVSHEAIVLGDLDSTSTITLHDGSAYDAGFLAGISRRYLRTTENDDGNFRAPGWDEEYLDTATSLHFPASSGALRRIAVRQSQRPDVGTTISYVAKDGSSAVGLITIGIAHASKHARGPLPPRTTTLPPEKADRTRQDASGASVEFSNAWDAFCRTLIRREGAPRLIHADVIPLRTPIGTHAEHAVYIPAGPSPTPTSLYFWLHNRRFISVRITPLAGADSNTADMLFSRLRSMIGIEG